jgi:hypothetical protein
LAVLAAPSFEIKYRDFDSTSDTDRRDNTLTWIKRSAVESLRLPYLKLDELTWLQSNSSAAYIPAQVYCPRRSTRLYPFFGAVRDTDDADALVAGIGEDKPPASALANTIARCRRDGPAMRAAGYTKEAALLQGDVDRFFTLNRLENSPRTSVISSNTSIVLEDAEIPAPIMAKAEAVLAARGNDIYGYLDDSNYDTQPGQVRRLKALVLAEALRRSKDIVRLKAGE